ncbi:cathepsin S-like [Bufo bufo]|uniref:cathepsin S-like n=1 Tax=Bufo bufo TaxID=8384 RepID=UPI001ABEB419|nr:cathepsin S-like [Bufo bufo]
MTSTNSVATRIQQKTMHFLVVQLMALVPIMMLVDCSPDTNLDNHWHLWSKTHEKMYNSKEDELRRRIVWEDNLKFIMLHNLEYSLGLHSYEVGMNHLGDMTSEEVLATMTGFSHADISTSNDTDLPEDVLKSKVPEAIDWRKQNCVTDVKDQGICSSSWAFSSVGSLECQLKIRKGKLVSLSAQNLVDCSGSYGNNGCSGGFLVAAYRYIIDHGIEADSTYPYEEKDVTCHFSTTKKAASMTSYKEVPYGNEDELKQVVGKVGPVSAAIDASRRSFYLYKNGVYYDPLCSSSQTNHAVLVVGYGAEDGVEYWLVKNSWRPSFGEEGYIKIARNHYNQCGIASFASYPVV